MTTLDTLLAPTLSMYGAAPETPAAPPTSMTASSAQVPADAASEQERRVREPLAAVTGLAIATGVAAGVSALVGSVMYPETKTRQFAAVGALAYAIPAGALLGVMSLYRAQTK